MEPELRDESLIVLRASVLGSVSTAALADLAVSASEVHHPSGSTVLSAGAYGDELFVVRHGAAEILSGDTVDPIAVAELGPGDVFGELSVIAGEPVRTATVRATSDLVCLVLPGARVRAVLDGDPEAARALQEAAELLLATRLLRAVSAFAPLDEASRVLLAQRVERREFEAGEEILTAGTPGDACFALYTGRAEVLPAGALDRDLAAATLGPGSLIGEIAVLTGEPRTATVRALEPSVALRLNRDDLLAALEGNAELSRGVIDLLRLRERPRRVEGIAVHERRSADGEPYAILKDPARGVYFRLSSLGRFVWDRLDGTLNVRDVALEYLQEGRGFAPEQIAEVIASLARSGFVRTSRVVPSLQGVQAETAPRGRGIADRIRLILTWNVGVRNVDGALTRLYEGGVRFFFTPVAQAIFAAVALSGVVASIALAHRATSHAGVSWWFFIPGTLLAILLHEAGHAFAAKAVGREVRRAGIGWFWFGPMAFVDTSDVWLATRRQRLAVALAGPYTTIVFAGALALLALAFPVARSALWVLALSSYLSMILNLNPLLELDGYYALVHALDRPNLRPKALAWIATEGAAALQHPSRLRGHGIDAAYASAALVYMIGFAVLLAVLGRGPVERALVRVLPTGAASILAWALVLGVPLLTLAGVSGDLIAARERAKSRQGA